MNSKILLVFIGALSFTQAGCGSNSTSPDNGGSPNPNYNTAFAYTPATGSNVLAIQIGGQSVCSAPNYINEPCTSVTLCVPGTSTCQTITDILVDTGSTGLRVFASAVTLSLPAVTDTFSNPIAECAQFGTGEDWGSVVQAGVVMANEPKVIANIQLINQTYVKAPSVCSKGDTSPGMAGFNGILGVGLAQHDCGSSCTTVANNQMYFGCTGGTCTSEVTPLTNQLQNPVSLLPTDNNGVIVEMPLIGASGASTVTGALVFGIGTQSNNKPMGETAFTTDVYGNMSTTYNGKVTTTAFIDSGSNTIFYPSTLSLCSGSGSFLCPSVTTWQTGLNTSNANVQGGVNFQIANASQIGSSVLASPTIGSQSSSMFDWGLPFFFGRRVYVGIETKTSSFGTGPYWAY